MRIFEIDNEHLAINTLSAAFTNQDQVRISDGQYFAVGQITEMLKNAVFINCKHNGQCTINYKEITEITVY